MLIKYFNLGVFEMEFHAQNVCEPSRVAFICGVPAIFLCMFNGSCQSSEIIYALVIIYLFGCFPVVSC